MSPGDWFFGQLLHMGANWRTTVSGLGSSIFAVVTVLAALPYTLGDISTIVNPAWKKDVFIVSGLATLALRVWNAFVQKDKSVTGGSIMQTMAGNIVPPESKPPLVETTKSVSTTP